MQMSQGSIPVMGAELYYETRGEGAPVLIVQGGINEAGATNQLAEHLAHHHQVITYDRRGISRSRVSESEPEISMSLHADDAALLLTAVTRAPARVVGASIGAVIGLHPMPRSLSRSCCRPGFQPADVDRGRCSVADAGRLAGLLDPVAVVSGSFDRSWAGALAPRWDEQHGDLGQMPGETLSPVLRGECPPSR